MEKLLCAEHRPNKGEATQAGQSPPSMDSLTISILDNDKSFQKLEKHWKDLENRAPTTIYMSFDWTYTWWKHYGHHKSRMPHLVTIWDKKKIIAIAPFYKGYTCLGTRVIATRMQLIGSGGSKNEQLGFKNDYGISDFLDVLVDHDYREKAAVLLAEYLINHLPGLNQLTFHQIRDDSYVFTHLLPLLLKTGLDIRVRISDKCPYIDLNNFSTLEDYLLSLRSSVRRRFRKTLRATGVAIVPSNADPEAGQMEIVTPLTEEEIHKSVDNLIALHQARWNRLGYPGVFSDERFIRFFKDTVAYCRANGWLWLKEVRDSDGVSSVRMLIRYKSFYYDYMSGFDDLCSMSKNRPGIGLILIAINDAIASFQGKESVPNIIELLRGEEPYKYDFTSCYRLNFKITVEYRRFATIWEVLVYKCINILALLVGFFLKESKIVETHHKEHGLFAAPYRYMLFRKSSLAKKYDAFRRSHRTVEKIVFADKKNHDSDPPKHS